MKVNIMDYGAKSDGTTVNTNFIQKAIDDCEKNGGGTVVVPAGKFITGTIRLKSNTELMLSHGSVLKASSDLSDYNELSEYPQNFESTYEGECWSGKHLIIAVEKENVAISGNGIIEGVAEVFYDGEWKGHSDVPYCEGYYQKTKSGVLRPGQMVCFVECTNIKIKDVTFKNSTCWNLFLHGCDYVQVTGIKVFNSKQHANTDGIDIDCCSYVTVSDCIIDTGDDCIAIRGDARRLSNTKKICEYITVSNCVLSNSACAIRMGVGVGKIRYVNISNLVISRTGEGITFMTGWKGNGSVEMSDIMFNNIISDDVGNPIQILAEEAEIKRVTIQNYQSNCKCRLLVMSTKGLISDLVLRDICIKSTDFVPKYPESIEFHRGNGIVDVTGVKRLTMDNVRLILHDSYYDDRKRAVSIKDTSVAKNDIKVIYKNEEI